MMVRSRLRGIAGAVLAVGALAAGMGMFVYRTAGARPQDAPAGQTAKAARSVSRKDDPSRTAKGSAGELVVRAADLSRNGEDEPFIGIVAIDPQTAKWRTIYTGLAIGPGPVSPDGRYLVSAIIGRNLDPQEAGIWVYDLTGQTPPRRIFEKKGEPFWANDGRQVIIGVPGRRAVSGSSRPGASMPMARAGPSCRSPTTTSSSIAPATGHGSRRGPSVAIPPIRDGSPWFTPTGPAPGT